MSSFQFKIIDQTGKEVLPNTPQWTEFEKKYSRLGNSISDVVNYCNKYRSDNNTRDCINPSGVFRVDDLPNTKDVKKLKMIKQDESYSIFTVDKRNITVEIFDLGAKLPREIGKYDIDTKKAKNSKDEYITLLTDEFKQYVFSAVREGQIGFPIEKDGITAQADIVDSNNVNYNSGAVFEDALIYRNRVKLPNTLTLVITRVKNLVKEVFKMKLERIYIFMLDDEFYMIAKNPSTESQSLGIVQQNVQGNLVDRPLNLQMFQQLASQVFNPAAGWTFKADEKLILQSDIIRILYDFKYNNKKFFHTEIPLYSPSDIQSEDFLNEMLKVDNIKKLVDKYEPSSPIRRRRAGAAPVAPISTGVSQALVPYGAAGLAAPMPIYPGMAPPLVQGGVPGMLALPGPAMGTEMVPYTGGPGLGGLPLTALGAVPGYGLGVEGVRVEQSPLLMARFGMVNIPSEGIDSAKKAVLLKLNERAEQRFREYDRLFNTIIKSNFSQVPDVISSIQEACLEDTLKIKTDPTSATFKVLHHKYFLDFLPMYSMMKKKQGGGDDLASDKKTRYTLFPNDKLLISLVIIKDFGNELITKYPGINKFNVEPLIQFTNMDNTDPDYFEKTLPLIKSIQAVLEKIWPDVLGKFSSDTKEQTINEEKIRVIRKIRRKQHAEYVMKRIKYMEIYSGNSATNKIIEQAVSTPESEPLNTSVFYNYLSMVYDREIQRINKHWSPDGLNIDKVTGNYKYERDEFGNNPEDMDIYIRQPGFNKDSKNLEFDKNSSYKEDFDLQIRTYCNQFITDVPEISSKNQMFTDTFFKFNPITRALLDFDRVYIENLCRNEPGTGKGVTPGGGKLSEDQRKKIEDEINKIADLTPEERSKRIAQKITEAEKKLGKGGKPAQGQRQGQDNRGRGGGGNRSNRPGRR